MPYVDGFVIPVPKKNLPAYFRMSRKAGKVWKDHGALEYRECLGDDLVHKKIALFPKAAKAKPGEAIVFSWIVYKSKAQRNKINASVMKDPRLASMMDPSAIPFDYRRMLYGGFKVMVNL